MAINDRFASGFSGLNKPGYITIPDLIKPANPINQLDPKLIRNLGIESAIPTSDKLLKQLSDKKDSLLFSPDSNINPKIIKKRLADLNQIEDEKAASGELTSLRDFRPQGSLSGIGEIDLAQESNQTLGDKLAGLDGSSTGAGANKKTELEAKILENQQIAEEERGIAGEITGDEIGATDPVDAPKSKYDTNMTELQNLFTTAMDEQKQLFGDLESDVGTKTIEDYKADFQKATGIDVSGEPDNKMALMSLGLSLMQNKAGKGFDLSKILTSVGEAGEAAMPAFQKAKDDARAGQIAAGKFALQQTQADEKTKLALAKEKRLALSALSKEFRTKAENRFLKKEDHLNAMEQKELVESIKLRAAIIKQGKSAGELTGKVLKIDPVDGQKGLSYSKSFKKDASQGSSVTVFNNAPEDIRRFKNASFNVNRARTTLNDIKNLAGQLLQPGVVPVMTQVSDKLKSIGVAFGIKPETLFKDQIISDGKGGFRTVEGVSKEQLSETLRDKLIVEYKRFLTQETGNGISNKDVEMVNKLIGKIDFFSNPKDAIEKINQVDTIFQKTQDQINNVFTAFRDKDSYMNEAQYNKAMSALGEDKGGNQVYKFGDSGRSFNVRMGENGRMIYSLKE